MRDRASNKFSSSTVLGKKGRLVIPPTMEDRLREVGNGWIQLKFKITFLGADVTPVVTEFVTWAASFGLKYVFGSLNVFVNVEQFVELKRRFGEKFELSEVPDGDFITEPDWNAYSLALFEAALKNEADRTSSHEFYEQFVKLFVLTGKMRAFSIRRELFEEIKLYCIRFSHKIEELSGLQVVVPKLDMNHSRAKNAAEMMRAFISIYPAYSAYCRNTRNVNKFYWDYTVDIDGTD